jgi:hypothetical protein
MVTKKNSLKSGSAAIYEIRDSFAGSARKPDLDIIKYIEESGSYQRSNDLRFNCPLALFIIFVYPFPSSLAAHPLGHAFRLCLGYIVDALTSSMIALG